MGADISHVLLKYWWLLYNVQVSLLQRQKVKASCQSEEEVKEQQWGQGGLFTDCDFRWSFKCPLVRYLS